MSLSAFPKVPELYLFKIALNRLVSFLKMYTLVVRGSFSAFIDPVASKRSHLIFFLRKCLPDSCLWFGWLTVCENQSFLPIKEGIGSLSFLKIICNINKNIITWFGERT